MLLNYSATKGAVHGFTRALSVNLADRGIRVNGVAPGPVWTPLNPADRSAADIEQFGSGTAMKLSAQPEEIACLRFPRRAVVLQLQTGVVIPVMGGPTG